MASSQGTQFIQQMNTARYIPFQMPLLTPHLPAATTMASSQGTQFIQQMNTARYIPFQMPLLTPHFTLSFLLFG